MLNTCLRECSDCLLEESGAAAVFRSEQTAAATVALAGAARRRRRRHGGKVSVDLYVGQMVPQPPDARPCDQLTVVQLDALEVVAVEEVLKGLVRDEGTVVQLQHVEGLAGAGRGAEVPDALVGDELAMGKGEGLEAGAVGGQLRHRGVRDEDALLQVHALKLRAGPAQCLKKNIQ